MNAREDPINGISLLNESGLVSKRSLEIMNLDETATREEVVVMLCITLGEPNLGDSCRMYKRFGGVETCTGRGEKDVTHVSWNGFCPAF